ncbi:natural cytotoxicity triggering receptor 3-like isoform X2 [Ambystoma mexicanum]|uniref:natural cytotoxicity triggering receptor 3-like isoform X2 n=1 Tax=Ambystoma mexicanum TaxID=8296 RepID=UPI0037E9462F
MNWLCLVLLLKIKPGISALVTVSQTPTVCATVGSTAKLDCSFSYNEVRKTTRGHYKWLKAPEHHVDNASEKYHDRIRQSNENGTLFFTNKRADIELLSVTQEDSGLYYCHVIIDGIGSGKGGGTQLHVQGGNKGRSQKQLEMHTVSQIKNIARSGPLRVGSLNLQNFLMSTVGVLTCPLIRRHSYGGGAVGRGAAAEETLSDPYALLRFGQDTYGIQPFQLNPEAFVYPEIGE